MLTTSKEEPPGLYELIHPLVRHWKVLLAGVVTGILVAGAITLLLPKRYETSFLLKIGSAADKQLEDSYAVVEIINSESFQQAAASSAGLNLSSKQLQNMVEAKTDSERWQPTWVSVQVLADAPDRALEVATAMIQGIIQRHTELFNESMRPYQDFEKDLQHSVALAEAETEKLKNNLEDYRSKGKTNASDEILLQSKLADLENQALALKKELHTLQTSMSTVHSVNTTVAAPPIRPTSPSRPNLKMNLAVACVASLFLMISFILLWEQYKKGSLRI